MLHNFKPLFSGSVSVLSPGPCSMQGQTICLSIQNHIPVAAHGFLLYLPPSWLLALSPCRYPPPISLLSDPSLIAFKILHGNRMLFRAVFLRSLGIKFPLWEKISWANMCLINLDWIDMCVCVYIYIYVIKVQLALCHQRFWGRNISKWLIASSIMGTCVHACTEVSPCFPQADCTASSVLKIKNG